MLALHCLRVKLGNSYRETIDLLGEMPGVLAELGLERPSHFTTLCAWFDRLSMDRWRALLARQRQQGPGRHAAIDATGFDRGQFSRYYAQRSGTGVRSRLWYRQFRERIAMAVAYDIPQQLNP